MNEAPALPAFYADHFVLPLPQGHRFPMAKYAQLRAALVEALPGIALQEAQAASDGELAMAHTPAYIESVVQGRLTPAAQREIGFPWSPAMVERSRRSVGATVQACRHVMAHGGVAANLAGGTHHAYAERGSGFCVFNDAAVAARLMQAEHGRTHRAQGPLRVAIVDPLSSMSIEALEDAIERYEGTTILVSHDRALLRALATKAQRSCDERLT
jgi:acetoin utilization deacetylase AcuC-like enzyme